MPEKFQGDIDSPKEKGKENELEKYKSALKELLGEYKKTKRSGKHTEWTEAVNFDISNSHREDMEKFWSDDFEITNFSALEKDGKEIGFNFYIGDTEFIIRGTAAARVFELLKNKK